MGKKITTTIYITEEQQTLLKELNSRTKIPVAEFVRQGIDLVCSRYQNFLPGQMELGALPLGQKNSELIEDKPPQTN